jgi:hypothetical protein
LLKIVSEAIFSSREVIALVSTSSPNALSLVYLHFYLTILLFWHLTLFSQPASTASKQSAKNKMDFCLNPIATASDYIAMPPRKAGLDFSMNFSSSNEE